MEKVSADYKMTMLDLIRLTLPPYFTMREDGDDVVLEYRAKTNDVFATSIRAESFLDNVDNVLQAFTRTVLLEMARQ